MHKLLTDHIQIARASMRQETRTFVKVNVPHIPTKEGGEHISNSLLIGVDVSSCDKKAKLLVSSGNSLSKFTVSNNYPGAKTLATKIQVQWP